MKRILPPLLAALLLSGCAAVKQHEKEYLADPMLIPGSDAAESGMDAHITGNREGSTTGGGANGGGCGC